MKKIITSILLMMASLGLQAQPTINQQPINIMNYGADATCNRDNSTALTNAVKAAIATNNGGVLIPPGCYHFNKVPTIQLNGTYSHNLAITSGGSGWGAVIDISTDFDPTATQGIFVLPTPTNAPRDIQMTIDGFNFRFHQPPDLVVQTTQSQNPGDTSITVASTAGIVTGMYLCDAGPTNSTNPSCQDNTIPVNFVNGKTNNVPGATVASVVGNTVNLTNGTIGSSGVGNGDYIHFASARSQFHTLAQGCSLTAGAPACKYPYAIYNNGMRGVRFEHIMFEGAWDGIYMGSNAQNFYMSNIYGGGMDTGLYFGDSANFPQLNNFENWNYGWLNAPISPWPNGGIALSQNWYDGNTKCIDIEGALNGVNILGTQCWNSSFIVNNSGAWVENFGVMMDGTYSSIIVNATSNGVGLNLFGHYHTSGDSTANGALVVNGGNVYVSGMNFVDCGSAVPIQVTGGRLQIRGPGQMTDCTHGAHEMATVTGGTLDIAGMMLDVGGAGTKPTNGLIHQSSTGVLIMKANTFLTDLGTGTGVQIDADVAGTYIGCDNNWNGWTMTLPASPYPNGSYCPTNFFMFPSTNSTGIGAGALASGTSGANNTAVGHLALNVVSSGVQNTAVGNNAGAAITTTSNSVVMGHSALAASTGGTNTVIGSTAMITATAGGGNTVVGYNAGNNMTTAGNDTIIGGSCNPSSATTGSEIDICAGGGVGSTIQCTGAGTPSTSTCAIAGKLSLPNTTSCGGATCASTGTLTNAPANTNPNVWIPVIINGTTRYIPAW